MKTFHLILAALLLSASLAQPMQAQTVHKEKTEKKFTTIDKASSIFAGIVLEAWPETRLFKKLRCRKNYRTSYHPLLASCFCDNGTVKS